ncbi:MAG: glycosyltransferase family 2 protein [Rhodospirillales bacterium]|nr:glycosyltransferase family 2 protein [Rhodospirillales bacterium]
MWRALDFLPDPRGGFRVALAAGGGWVRLTHAGRPVSLAVETPDLPGPMLLLSAPGAVVCLPEDTTALRAHGPCPPPALALRRLSRPAAALALARRHAPALLAGLARGLAREPLGLPRRLRALLGEVAMPAPPAPATPALPRAAAWNGPAISLIVPSTFSRAARRSLRRILAGTDYADLELILVLSRPACARRRQHLAADPRVRMVEAPMRSFNFAAACNAGAAIARGALLGLLNDDVTPREPGWLAAMAGHLRDPATGIVGARLLYPDGAIQHDGVTLCADGTGRHLNRFRSRREAGPTREVAAVTGACLLTPRALWRRLGGLDESYASAFNDLDYCLRAREAGARVVLCAEAVLTHAESRSFRRHYRPDEAARNRADRARLLSRHPAAFNACRDQ